MRRRGLLAGVASVILAVSTVGPVSAAGAAPPPAPVGGALPYGYRATRLVSATGQVFSPSDTGNPISATDRIAGALVTPHGEDFTQQAAVFYVANRTIRVLRPPGSTWAIAADINRRGQVAGTAFFVGEPEQAFVWSPDTNTYRMIRSLGSNFARPTALNDSGVVVGSSTDAAFADHAFLSDPAVDGGRMQDLGSLPGEAASVATGINNAGDVVGYTYGVDDRAFFRDHATKVLTDLGHPAGDNDTRATDVNDRGFVVGATGYDGYFENKPSRRDRPFVYDPTTHQFRILPSRSDQSTVATAINVHGIVVGTGRWSGDDDRALIWNACGQAGAVLVEDQWGTAAVGINAHEHVVGSTHQGGTFWRRNDGPCRTG